MKNKINVIMKDGEKKEVYLITFLSLEKYNSLYLAYTENELTGGDNVVVFAKVEENDDKMMLVDIPNEELPDVMNEFKKEYDNHE